MAQKLRLRSRPSSLLLPLFILSILLFFPSPSLAALTATSGLGSEASTILADAHLVKGMKACGLDDLYDSSYSSISHDAPLRLLSLDRDLCDELRTGKLSPHRSFANSTLLVFNSAMMWICDYNFIGDYEMFYLTLNEAGASAVVLATTYEIPGIQSNIKSP
jgi:hypothetical protein